MVKVPWEADGTVDDRGDHDGWISRSTLHTMGYMPHINLTPCNAVQMHPRAVCTNLVFTPFGAETGEERMIMLS